MSFLSTIKSLVQGQPKRSWSEKFELLRYVFVAVALIAGGMSLAYDSWQTNRYIESPKSGDFVVYKAEKNSETPYQAFKIANFSDKGVYVIDLEYAYNKASFAVKEVKNKKDNQKYFVESESYYMTLDDFKSLDIDTMLRFS